MLTGDYTRNLGDLSS